MSETRHVEDWLAVVMASALKDRAKVTAYGLSRFADWNTGRDCYPSDPRLAAVVGCTARTARRGRADLEAAGFIRRTGRQAPTQPVDYILVIPETTDKVVPSSTDKVVPSGLRDYGQVRHRLRTGEVESADKVVLLPPHTSSRPLGSEGGRKSASAHPPQGGALPRLSVAEVRELLTEALPEAAAHGVKCDNSDLAEALAAALTAGWTTETIAAALADMRAPKTSPTGQAIARLRALAASDPHAVILATDTNVSVETVTSLDGRTQPATPSPRPAGDVLADDDRQPGPDGFGHFDPPTRKTIRHRDDTALKAADAAEKQRQIQALAQLSAEGEQTA